jgi:hypothetical protein
MPISNAAATLLRAGNFGGDYAGASLSILDGATVLVSHTITSFTASNTGNAGTATGVIATAGAATIIATGEADGARLEIGGLIETLTAGVADPDPSLNPEIVLTTPTYIINETSTLNSLVATFPSQ